MLYLSCVTPVAWDEKLLMSRDSIWNLFHTAIHRHTLGRDLHQYMNCAHDRRHRTNRSGSSNPNTLPVPGGFLNRQRENTPAQLGRGPDSQLTISLADVRGDDKGPDLGVTNRSNSSVTSGDSSSQAVSATMSGRTSTAVSEETLEADAEADGAARVDRKP